jgi:hypothetical protein
VDIILIEPRPDDHQMFFHNILRYSTRLTVARHDFESVTMDLAEDYTRYKASWPATASLCPGDWSLRSWPRFGNPATIRRSSVEFSRHGRCNVIVGAETHQSVA